MKELLVQLEQSIKSLDKTYSENQESQNTLLQLRKKALHKNLVTFFGTQEKMRYFSLLFRDLKTEENFGINKEYVSTGNRIDIKEFRDNFYIGYHEEQNVQRILLGNELFFLFEREKQSLDNELPRIYVARHAAIISPQNENYQENYGLQFYTVSRGKAIFKPEHIINLDSICENDFSTNESLLPTYSLISNFLERAATKLDDAIKEQETKIRYELTNNNKQQTEILKKL